MYVGEGTWTNEKVRSDVYRMVEMKMEMKRGSRYQRGKKTPNRLSPSSATLYPEGILIWGRQKRHYDMESEISQKNSKKSTYPRPSRERGRIVVHIVGALKVAYGKRARLIVEIESPISNGLTTVAELKLKLEQKNENLKDIRGAKTRF